jgi:hypothetical protein
MRFLHRYLVLIIAVIMLIVCSRVRWTNEDWGMTILSDGKGYYGYLPAIFLYDDLQFGFVAELEKEYYAENFRVEYRSIIDGKTVNKYYAGTAVAMSPFFLAGNTAAYLSEDYPTDGYAKPYAVAVSIAAVFYLCLGLWFLKKLLDTFGSTPGLTVLLVSAIAFGTNAFYYTIGEPSMSHIYSFAFFCMFLWAARKYFLQQKTKHLLLCAAAFGMIVLIRPVNGIVILSLPFIAGSIQNLQISFRALTRNIFALAGAALIVIAIVSIQFIIYKLQTGKFIVYSYGGEGFNWSDPQIINFLISYKKGVFVYVPLWFLALPGFVWLFRTNRFAATSLFIFLALVVYSLSSWWNWWYGGSYGSRVFVEYLPFLALLLLFTFQLMKRKALKVIYVLMVMLLVYHGQAQTLSYRRGLMHWEDMTKEKYWNVFMKWP